MKRAPDEHRPRRSELTFAGRALRRPQAKRRLEATGGRSIAADGADVTRVDSRMPASGRRRRVTSQARTRSGCDFDCDRKTMSIMTCRPAPGIVGWPRAQSRQVLSTGSEGGSSGATVATPAASSKMFQTGIFLRSLFLYSCRLSLTRSSRIFFLNLGLCVGERSDRQIVAFDDANDVKAALVFQNLAELADRQGEQARGRALRKPASPCWSRYARRRRWPRYPANGRWPRRQTGLRPESRGPSRQSLARLLPWSRTCRSGPSDVPNEPGRAFHTIAMCAR